MAVLRSVAGVRVTAHAYGLETAFEAEYGAGGRVVAFNAEYDALPGIGHACGHNLIATVGLSAFLAAVDALKAQAAAGRAAAGRVRLLGTPAEETTGGKVRLVAAGAYADVDACLMMHPTTQAVYARAGADGSADAAQKTRPDDAATVYGDAYDCTLAITGFAVDFAGTPAHAALAPWDGVNALDAAVAGYAAVSALRQQMRPDERIHGIITDGGLRPNIIPAHTRLEYGVRAPTLARARALQTRAVRCFEGAAAATGCTVAVTELGFYADLRTSLPICHAFVDAMAGLGRTVQCNSTRATTPASTDQGNVSYACPSWHGIFGIPCEAGAYPHAPAFAAAAGSRRAFERALKNGEGMALTGYRILVDDALAAAIRAAFDKQKAADGDLEL